jgi:hypothetical protein
MRFGTTLQLNEDLSRSYYYDGEKLVYIDSDSVARAVQTVTRAWICPEQAKNADVALQEIWLDLLYRPEVSSHALTVLVSLDFNDENQISATWTSTELAELSVGGRVTVSLNLNATVCRSFKVTVINQELGEGEPLDTPVTPMRLIRGTVIYRSFAGVQRRRLLQGALK